jgi:hypothetical protein
MKIDKLLEAVKTDSNISATRVMGLMAVQITYYVWAAINICNNLAMCYKAAFKDGNVQFDIIGLTQICTLTGALAIAKAGQAYAENMQPKEGK